MNFVHRRVITEHLDPPKTSGLWLVVEHFYGLKQILTAISLQGHICVLEENLGHFTLIVEKQLLNHLSVGSIFLHNLGTFVTLIEPYLIIIMSVRLERIYPCLLTYYNLI